MNMLASLRPSATAEQARAELTAFLGRVEAPAAWRHARGVVHSLPDLALGDTKPALLLVALAAALLLLITCVNVANLMLVRAVGRVREFAVRSALGAGRGRLLGQVVTESALLSLVGGVIGVGLSVAGVRAFVAIAPDSIPRLDEIGVDGSAVGAAVVVTAMTMLVAGLGPAWFTSRVDAHDLIRSGARTTGGRRVRRVTELLVIGQVALAAAVLSAAGLVSRSLVKLQHVDLSFEPKGLLVANLTMRQDQIGGRERQQAALDLVVARATALPGVLAVTPVITVPLVGAGGGIDGRPTKPGQTREEIAEDPIVNMEAIAPNHFTTLGTRVLRGRAFGEQDRDGASPVAIVSSGLARHFWPGGDPIGQRLNGPGHEVTVVGVVPDTRYRQLQDARPTLYVPLAQSPFPMIPSALLVRLSVAPASMVPALRRTVADARVGATLVSAMPLEQLLAAPRAEPRLNAMVLTLFALSAMFLAAIGLFAVIATLVRHRTQELGIRMALGATAGALGRLVIARGLALATAGAAIGLVGALAGSRLLSSLLFEVSPTDAATQLAVVALMACVGVIASLAPMRRCMRIDPAGALRSEG